MKAKKKKMCQGESRLLTSKITYH